MKKIIILLLVLFLVTEGVHTDGPNLKEVTLPNKVIDIGKWSFKGCPNLQKIYVKKNSKTDKVLKKSSFKKYINYL